MTLLKLIALEPADVPVLAAHLQDAVISVRDMTFDPRSRRFAFLCNRFNWQVALDETKAPERRRAGVRIEGVSGVKTHGFEPRDKSAVLAVLTVLFVPAVDPAEAPAGVLSIVCAGGAELRLTVESVEMAAEDLGPVWQAQSAPDHGNEAAS